MDFIFTYDRDKFENGELRSSEVKKLIERFESILLPDIKRNMDYYLGMHDIVEHKRDAVGGINTVPNNLTVCNHAKDIADTASGYFLGSPINYKSKSNNEKDNNIIKLNDALSHAEADDIDQENALFESITGRSYELIYPEEDEAMLKIAVADPMHTFMVCDESIEHRELFAVYYYHKYDDVNNKIDPKTYITVYTDTVISDYVLAGDEDADPVKITEHNLGFIPVVEYKNNKFCIGDFEQQIGLIDAYNTLMADRVNDKEQFIDAILVIYGSLLGDDADKSDEAMKELHSKKLLELDPDSKAEYLTRTFDENGMEVLRKAIKEDIYTFSHVPNLTDQNFAGNSSGVAMEYKLLGLEMLTKIKERWYRKSLRKRLRIFLHYLGLKSTFVEESDIDVSFSRGLPKNLLELSQIINNLSDDVSKRTLISLLPFVEDPDAEIKAVTEEKDQAVERQQKAFGQSDSDTANNPLDDVKNDE